MPHPARGLLAWSIFRNKHDDDLDRRIHRRGSVDSSKRTGSPLGNLCCGDPGGQFTLTKAEALMAVAKPQGFDDLHRRAPASVGKRQSR